MILGLEGKTGEMLQNIIVSSCIFMETEDAEGCVGGIERKMSHIYHYFHNITTHTYYVASQLPIILNFVPKNVDVTPFLECFSE